MTNEVVDKSWQELAREAQLEREEFRCKVIEQSAAIEQLHAAVKTAQELAATRLMEKDRIVAIGEKARLFLAQEIERLTRDMAALQSQWDDMQQGFVEVFGEPVRDAIELLGTVERIRSGNEPCEQPQRTLQEDRIYSHRLWDRFLAVHAERTGVVKVRSFLGSASLFRESFDQAVLECSQGASRDASLGEAGTRCGNWPCMLQRNHTGPCSSSTLRTGAVE